MSAAPAITIMLCGDVMLGRGIDQVLPHPSSPELYEQHMRTALGYLALAESANGPIPRPVQRQYIWGDAMDELARRKPDLRIINLETAVTRSDRPEPKGINYRMNPDNLPCLTTAGIDCCVLANNHVLDWGQEGLLETVIALGDSGIKTAGAGHDAADAQAPAILEVKDRGRVLVYAAACRSSGVPPHWSAGPKRPGVHLIDELSAEPARHLAARISHDRRPTDIVVLSIHWGGNWGYEVPLEERTFARHLIDSGQIDIIHGHSSHHFKAAEIYRGRPILYGCGDFLNDYEGISGHKEYRSDLVLMYLLTISISNAHLMALDIVPFRLRNFRLNRTSRAEAEWIWRRMDELCRPYQSGAVRHADGALSLLSHTGNPP